MSERTRFFSYTREEFLDEFAHPDDRPAVEEAHQRSGEVKFIRGNDRISQMAGRPDIADDVAQIPAAMAEADRAYAMRLAAEFTQAEPSEG
ncbi:MAG TPA: hypothetical protein VHZ03_05015 [Trebonia sp.]|jgi:hypothetical protein|nr:hypothetical protein [Trebonia sp.]